MTATLDFGKLYADGKVSTRPIQQAIIHKNQLMSIKVIRVSKIRL